MRDLDLIPNGYRDYLRLIRRVKVAGTALLATVVAVAAGHILLVRAVHRETRAIATLQAEKRLTTERRTALEALHARQNDLQRRLALFDGLRGGPMARRMFPIIDAAVEGGDVWFTHWRFQRAGTEVEAKPEAVHTGYFVVLPADAGHPENKALKVDTHMEIQGQARDHSALAAFVGRLYGHPEIADVKVLRTDTRQGPAPNAVDFEVAVVVTGRPQSPTLALSEMP